MPSVSFFSVLHFFAQQKNDVKVAVSLNFILYLEMKPTSLKRKSSVLEEKKQESGEEKQNKRRTKKMSALELQVYKEWEEGAQRGEKYAYLYFQDSEITEKDEVDRRIRDALHLWEKKAKKVVEGKKFRTPQMFFAVGVLYSCLDQRERASSMWKKAAELGHIEALYYLGELYLHQEEESDENMSLALKYYTAAVEKGHVDALLGLSECYYNSGLGTEEDLEKSEELLEEAIAKGSVQALCVKGDELYNVEEYKKAIKFYKQAALKGSRAAVYHMLECWELAKEQGNIKVDINEQRYWERKSVCPSLFKNDIVS